jgi:hypothetical protein
LLDLQQRRLVIVGQRGGNWTFLYARIRRMARDFPAFLERFIYNDQCVMLD